MFRRSFLMKQAKVAVAIAQQSDARPDPQWEQAVERQYWPGEDRPRVFVSTPEELADG